MRVQVRFPRIDKEYSYWCINKASIGDKVIILNGALTGWKGTVTSIVTVWEGDYKKCWRPEFDINTFTDAYSEKETITI